MNTGYRNVISCPPPPLPPPLPPCQILKLRKEKGLYEVEYPERVQLLKDMGFEWEYSAVQDEWERILLGELTVPCFATLFIGWSHLGGVSSTTMETFFWPFFFFHVLPRKSFVFWVTP